MNAKFEPSLSIPEVQRYVGGTARVNGEIVGCSRRTVYRLIERGKLLVDWRTAQGSPRFHVSQVEQLKKDGLL
jgi:hypothetical protein